MNDFAVYVHWPFCAAKCPYCDFNSHVRTQIDESGWIDAILKELEWTAQLQGADRPIVRTVFFGGGTPSLMQGRSVAAVLDKIASLWRTANDVEVTLESNPASADAERFRDYRAAGVNRLSLGVQALNDADLKFLGRLHDVAEAKAALAMAMAAFDRVSLDLIYARPNQTPDAWRAELREALSFGTDHLSLYQLTIEPATPFATMAKTGALRIPDDDHAASLYEITAGTDRGRAPPGLRNLQPCRARRGMPPQSRLLALRRLRRRRSRRAWPSHPRRQTHRDGERETPRTLARDGDAPGPRHRGDQRHRPRGWRA